MSTQKAAKFSPITAIIVFLFALGASGALAGESSGYLGVILQDSDDGILVKEVVDGSPADDAGLKNDDVIIKFKGKDLEDHSALSEAVVESSPGENVEVVVLRDGKEKVIEIELGQREEYQNFLYSSEGELHFSPGDQNVFVWSDDDGSDQVQLMLKGMNNFSNDRGFMGIGVDDINEQMGEYFEVEDGEGALITFVNEDSAANDADLKAGDVIIKIGDHDIKSASDVHPVLAETEPGEELEIRIIRKGKKKNIDITLGEVPESQFFSSIESSGGDNEFFIQSPKMLLHGMSDPHKLHKQVRILCDDENDLKEMRDELDKMKKELEKMKEELSK